MEWMTWGVAMSGRTWGDRNPGRRNSVVVWKYCCVGACRAAYQSRFSEGGGCSPTVKDGTASVVGLQRTLVNIDVVGQELD